MVSNFQGLYNIRDYKPSDKNFIMATFLRGLYYGDSWFSLMPKSAFMDNYKHVAEAMLKKHTVKVACLKDDPDVILGYSILSHDFKGVHWVYVKESKRANGDTWRRKGIAKSLLPERPEYFTHLTELGKSLMPKFKDTVFNPFKL